MTWRATRKAVDSRADEAEPGIQARDPGTGVRALVPCPGRALLLLALLPLALAVRSHAVRSPAAARRAQRWLCPSISKSRVCACARGHLPLRALSLLLPAFCPAERVAMADAFGGVPEKVRRTESDVDSDEDEQFDKWIPSRDMPKGLTKEQPCKGCGKVFVFKVAPGKNLRNSPSVQAYYEHCLNQCMAYMDLCKCDSGRPLSDLTCLSLPTAMYRSCDHCRCMFLNDDQKRLHIEDCDMIARSKELKRKQRLQERQQPLPAPGPDPRRRRTSTSSHSSNPESNSPDQNVDDDEEDFERMLSNAVQNKAEEMIAKIKVDPAKAAADVPPAPRRRMGPLSRTQSSLIFPPEPKAAASSAKAQQQQQQLPASASASHDASASACLRVTPADAAAGPSYSKPTSSAGPSTQAAPTGRPGHRPGPKSKTKPAGYDEGGRVGPLQRAPVVPSQDAIRQVEAGRRLSGKNLEALAKTCKRHSTPSNPGQKRRAKGSSGRKAKQKRAAEPETDDEEYPEYIKQLPDVVLTPDEYEMYIPAKSRNCQFFNNSLVCRACNKSFPAFLDSSGSHTTTIPCPEYYKHCLQQCPVYMKKHMKSCDVCFHRYLDEEEFAKHKRGSNCSKQAKRMAMLKLKMPWMPRQLFLDLIAMSMNAKMCCPGCSQQFACHKKANDYTPGLELQCHMLDECDAYRKSGESSAPRLLLLTQPV